MPGGMVGLARTGTMETVCGALSTKTPVRQRKRKQLNGHLNIGGQSRRVVQYLIFKFNLLILFPIEVKFYLIFKFTE